MGVEKPLVEDVELSEKFLCFVEKVEEGEMHADYNRQPNQQLQWMRVAYDLKGEVWHRVNDTGEVTFELRYRSVTEGRVTMFVSFPLHTYPCADLVPISRTEIDYWK